MTKVNKINDLLFDAVENYSGGHLTYNCSIRAIWGNRGRLKKIASLPDRQAGMTRICTDRAIVSQMASRIIFYCIQ